MDGQMTPSICRNLSFLIEYLKRNKNLNTKVVILNHSLTEINTLEDGLHPSLGLRSTKIGTTLNININGSRCSEEKNDNSINLYMGIHGTEEASTSNIVLPYVHPYEKDSVFIDVFGVKRKAQSVVSSPLKLIDNHVILKAILSKLNIEMPSKITWDDIILKCSMDMPDHSFKQVITGAKDVISHHNISSTYNRINNYYQDNIITNYSSTMLKCSKHLLTRQII